MAKESSKVQRGTWRWISNGDVPDVYYYLLCPHYRTHTQEIVLVSSKVFRINKFKLLTQLEANRTGDSLHSFTEVCDICLPYLKKLENG